MWAFDILNEPEKLEISPFELSKEDISNWKLSFNLFKKLNIFFKENFDDISNYDIFSTSKEKRGEILWKLDELWINNDSLEKIDINKKWYLQIIYLENWERKEIYFDLLERGDFYKWNLLEIGQQKKHNEKQSILNLEKTDKILDAMDYMLLEVKKWIFGWEINKKDYLWTQKFWKELGWKTLKELQVIFKKYFENIDNIDIKSLPISIQRDILKQKKKYLEIVMWIGDTYESAAQFLRESEKGFESITENLIKNYSIRESLDFLIDFHKKIDDNNYQSTSVERSYEYTMTTLHSLVLTKLKNENASDQYFLKYAKIITWRWKVINYSNWDIDWRNSDIDDNLRDQKNSNDAILFIMNRKWGIIEKINKEKSIDIVDEKIENKKPLLIVNNLRNIYYESFWIERKYIKEFDDLLKLSWYEDILNLWEKDYSDLNIGQKIKVSVLYRVLEKFKSWKNIWDKVKDIDFIDNSRFAQEEFAWLFNEVAKDYIEESMNESEVFFSSTNFFWKSAKDYWFRWSDAEIFELFQDINGAGLLDFSDNTISWLKTTWKIAWVMTIAIAVPFLILPAATIVTQGASAWAAASIASMAINPKWYDTVWEAIVDISSDVVVWTVTWAAWWYLAKIMWVETAELFSKQWWKVAWIFALDLAFLWLVPEAWRMMYVDSVYHNQDILDK